MNVGDRVTFHDLIGGSWGADRDGQEATVTITFPDNCIIPFDDGFQIFATAAELVALTL